MRWKKNCKSSSDLLGEEKSKENSKIQVKKNKMMKVMEINLVEKKKMMKVEVMEKGLIQVYDCNIHVCDEMTFFT